MAYYNAIDVYLDITNEKAASEQFTDSHKVKKEGVYYSYFIYERVPLSEEED